MPFTRKPRTFKAIGTLSFGTGEHAVTFGGGTTLPLYFFDAKPAYAPAIGVEVTDIGWDTTGLPLLAKAYEGATTLADRVKRAASFKGADFIYLRFEGADPGGENKSVEECVKLAKEAVAATTKPLAIAGCKDNDKDVELFKALAEALEGKNILFLSAGEENYKRVAASVSLAFGHKVVGESAVDINLAKQLNVLLTQLGVAKSSIAMNLGGSAAGYGYEYVSSTMDRVKQAALEQDDAMLQLPVITTVSTDSWSVKESMAPESDAPEWGALEPRGIQMEVVTATADLTSGSDAIILRHPVSVDKLAALVAALI